MTPGSRRGYLLLGGAAAAIALLPKLWGALRPLPPATPHPTVAGFSLVDAGPVSGGIDPLIGLAAPEASAADSIAPADIGHDVCAALFDAPTPGDGVPVAVFTDINCPYCRQMQRWLVEVPPAEAAITWHDLPLLGDASVAAARAIGAAGLQGAGPLMRERLHRTRFAPDPAFLTALAESIGLDAPRLLADMRSPAVEARIARSLGLAELFGLPGTPALVVGGAVAVGRREEAEFRDLLGAARDGTIPVPCR